MASLARREIEQGLPWSWTPDKLKRFFTLASTNGYVAQVNGEFAGFSIASLGDARAHLVLLAVEKKWRNCGVGRELLDWQLLAAQTAGLTDMSLEVRTGNRPAQLFYAAAGFARVRTLPEYYCGVEDAVRLRLCPVRARQAHTSEKNPSAS